MIFESTRIAGLWRIVVQRGFDDRGSFGRLFCRDEFAAHGLATVFVQTSSSRTKLAGTVRGMHLQLPPDAESKLVRCTRGAIHDIVCDLRPSSATYLCFEVFPLDQDADVEIYIPSGCAHGFQTVSDDVEVTYAMSRVFAPASATGVRFDDPALGLAWPFAVTSISEKDLSWRPYDSALFPGI